MKNCRTCKYADWRIKDSGRKSYWSWAECTVFVDISVLPASAIDAIRLLERTPRGVASHENHKIDCNCYEKLV